MLIGWSSEFSALLLPVLNLSTILENPVIYVALVSLKRHVRPETTKCSFARDQLCTRYILVMLDTKHVEFDVRLNLRSIVAAPIQ